MMEKDTKKEKKKSKPKSQSTNVDSVAGSSERSEGNRGRDTTSHPSLDKNERKSSPMNKKNNKRRAFTPYWSREDVDSGLKRKQLIKGEIRINQRAFEEAYVPHPDGKSDIFLDGIPARNRSLNSDVVVVKLYPRDQWRVMVDQIHRRKPSQSTDNETVAPSTVTSHTASQSQSMSDDDEDDVIVEGETLQIADGSGEFVTSQTDDITGSDPVTSSCSTPPVTSSCSTPPRQKNVNHQKTCVLLGDYKGEVDDGCLQKTGQVVYITERCHSRSCAGILKPMPDKNPNMSLFCPTDSRVPRICIPMKDCPADYRTSPDSYSNLLCVARIQNWEESSRMPLGKLVTSLGEAGDIEPETEGVLMAYDVDFKDFDQAVLDCLPDTPWVIPDKEYTKRRDLRSDCVFTIDPATARDLDDALSCRHLGNGIYEVGVHIADVSYFIKENTELDKVASKRATSVYLVQKVIPMLPRLLCEQLCSLNPNQDKLTFSSIWKMTENGEIIDEWFGRTIIRSCVKLSYQHAQKFIDNPDHEWNAEFPALDDVTAGHQVRQSILDLNKLAVKMRADRFKNGALRLDQVKLAFSLNRETGLPSGCHVYQYTDSNKLIEEFMLLANMAVAHKLYKSSPHLALLRRHPEPQEKMMVDLVRICEGLGINITGFSSAEMQKCLLEYLHDDDSVSMAKYHVLTQLCTKPMQYARYFCTGSIEDEYEYRHYALNVPLYTHFTSPIRRFADVIVHRQLAASLDLTTPSALNEWQLQKQAEKCNLKKNNSKKVQEFSSDLFFSVFIKECGPLEREGMVMAVLNKSFDVLVISLGVVKRVYIDKLAIKSSEYRKKDNVVPELDLMWNIHGEDFKQKIRIFTSVWCYLTTDDGPLRWKMTIAHRFPSEEDEAKNTER